MGQMIENMKHIVSFSGGKDSTSMLLRMIELDMQIDEIRYFDCGSWEFPQMIEHINKVEEYIKRPITRMKYKYDFGYLFSRKTREKGTRSGKCGYGFPTMVYRWCTGKKTNVLAKGVDRKNTTLYIGYAVDELSRTRPLSARKIPQKFPLIEWGWSEKECLEYCYSKGFNWNGLYKHFHRVSCWCCPFQGLKELRNLRKHFPVLWKRLLDMQEKSWNSFRMDGKTVLDLDKRFEMEDKQMKLF